MAKSNSKKPTDLELKELLKEVVKAKNKTTKNQKFQSFLNGVKTRFGAKPTKEFDKIVTSVLDGRNPLALRLLAVYYEDTERLYESILTLEKAVNISADYKSLHNLAKNYSYLNDFQKSIYAFEEALKQPIKEDYDKSIIIYNYGFTLHLMGNYEAANKVFKDLNDFYESFPKKKRDADYWVDVGDNYLYNQSETHSAIAAYEEGLKVVDEDKEANIKLELLNGLINAINKRLSSTYSFYGDEHGKYTAKVYQYFQVAINLVVDQTPNDNELAELHFYNKDYQSAQKHYEKLVLNQKTLRNEKGDIYYFLGLCHFYQKDYIKAIDYFQKSIRQVATNFVLVHLVHAYRSIEKFDKAQDNLDIVLKRAPFNVNAIFAQLHLFADQADFYLEKNKDRSSRFYDLTIGLIKRLYTINGNSNYQRDLTPNENVEIQYLHAFCLVNNSRNVKSSNKKLAQLKEAQELLSELIEKEEHAYYFKSKRMLDELNQAIDDFERREITDKKSMVWIASVLSIITFVLILLGRPTFVTGYKLDVDFLIHQVNNKNFKVPKSVYDKVFNSLDDMEEYASVLVSDFMVADKKIVFKPLNSNYLHVGRESVSDAIIIVLISASIFFALLSYISDQIKVLKVGVLEVEKVDKISLMEQIELKASR